MRYANAAVFTGRRDEPWTQSVVTRADSVVAVGALADLREQWPTAAEIDLDGGTVLPGLIDAHNHFLSTGESLVSLDLRYPAVGSAAELLRIVRDAAASAAVDATISGFGFDDSRYDLPTLAELDAASDGRRLHLFHTSGHHVLVNSVVLDAAGVVDATPDPPGGAFVRNPAGRLTGLCRDAATGAVLPTAVDVGSHGPNFHVRAPLDELVAAVDRASQAYLAAGLTCVADAQVTARELAAYREARRRGLLGPRTVCMPLSHQLDDFAAIGLVGPFGDDHLSVGHLKVYADGTLTGGSAAFSGGLDIHGQTASYFHQPSRLHDLLECAWAAGWQIAVHAQGDAAIAAVLDGFEAAQHAHAQRQPRPRIEHAGLPRASGVQRMAALGVAAVTQPSYLHDFGSTYLESLGELAHDLQPWDDFRRAGVRVVISSDSDVTSYRPLTTIGNAMQRTTAEGTVLGARHRMSLEDALFAHTCDAAFVVGLEHRIGSLEPGKAADLTLLTEDLRTLEPAQVQNVPVHATIIDGRPRYERAGR